MVASWEGREEEGRRGGEEEREHGGGCIRGHIK